jgi:hypothetical protein
MDVIFLKHEYFYKNIKNLIQGKNPEELDFNFLTHISSAQNMNSEISELNGQIVNMQILGSAPTFTKSSKVNHREAI